MRDAQRESVEGLPSGRPVRRTGSGGSRWPEATGDPLSRRRHARGDRRPKGRAADTEAAIAAARRAFDDGPWPRTPERERGALLLRTADLLERDAKEFARAESLDTGKRLVESEYDIDDVVCLLPLLRRASPAPTPAGWSTPDATTPISRVVLRAGRRLRADHARGTTRCCRPSWKVAPALAGRQHVRPQAQRAHPVHLDPADAGAGGGRAARRRRPTSCSAPGPRSGAPLAEHPDVDLVSFTGGLDTGRRIMAAAAATVKKVALELGGKNPNVVFADADFETAVDFALTAVFLHSGQVCSAGARLIVEDSLHDRFVDEVVRRAERIRLGGPFDPEAETGPLISAAAPGEGRGVRRGRPRRGRRAALRRRAARRPRARGRLLLPAHRARRVPRRTCGWCTRSPSGPC